MSLRGEMEIGGELVGLEIGVIPKELGQEGQSAGRVFSKGPVRWVPGPVWDVGGTGNTLNSILILI